MIWALSISIGCAGLAVGFNLAAGQYYTAVWAFIAMSQAIVHLDTYRRYVK